MKKILTALSIVSISYLSAVELTLDKPDYTTTDTIKINFSEMDNHHKDWIAIYPKGSSTAWKNVVKWAWTYNKSEGTFTFKNLPAGEYEARAFFNNSYEVETTKTFKVKGSGLKAELSPTKPIFTYREDVRINFKNINGATNDWLAIYPADKDNSWGNVVKWKYNKGGVKEGQANFDELPAGKYEARIFYNNTFKMEGKTAFEVREMVVPDKKYRQRFYTEDRSYSLAYTENMPNVHVYVLDKYNLVTDDKRMYSTPNNRLSISKLDGVDIFRINKDGAVTQVFYRIKDGKLINLHLKKSNGDQGRVESRGYHYEETIDNRKLLTVRYYSCVENRKYIYVYDVTDLDNVKLIKENFVE